MRTKEALKSLQLLAIANFAAFGVLAFVLGGDAINGHAEGGLYYLSSHGKLTQVSEATFNYSMVHAISVIALFGAAFLSEIALRTIKRRERIANEQSTDALLNEMRAHVDADKRG